MSIEYLVEGNRHRHWIDAHPTADLIDLHKEGRTMEGVLRCRYTRDHR